MPQGHPDWTLIRKGRPTASQFKKIFTPVTEKLSKSADVYAAELIAEGLGWYSGFAGTPDTERGVRLEGEAVRWLALRYGLVSRQVGFCLSDCGRYGASPDALIDDGRPLEVKCPDIHTFIKWRIDGGLPDEHKVQVHGGMILTGAPGAVFLAYTDHRAIENMMIEVPRDAFTEKLAAAVDQFCDRLDVLREEMLGEESQFYQPKPASDFAEWEENVTSQASPTTTPK
jgi:hypothetical protein